MIVVARNVPSKAPCGLVFEKKTQSKRCRKREGEAVGSPQSGVARTEQSLKPSWPPWITELGRHWNSLFYFCFFREHIPYQAYRGSSNPGATWAFLLHLCHQPHLPPSLLVQVPEGKLGASSTFQIRVQVTWAASCGRGWVEEGVVVTQWWPFSSDLECGRQLTWPIPRKLLSWIWIRKLAQPGYSHTFSRGARYGIPMPPHKATGRDR